MHPILFRIGDFPIGTYGLMVGLGFLAGLAYMRRSLQRVPNAAELAESLALVIMIAALAGSRIVYIFVEWRWFLRDPLALIFSREGFVFYGGFLAALAAAILYARRRAIPVRSLADALAPAIALGHFFGRIGCFLNGCCYGHPCSLSSPLTRFPRVVDNHEYIVGSPPFLDQLNQGLVAEWDLFSLPVHPTQLYEAGCLLLLFVGLHQLSKRVRWAPGMLLLLYAAGYAVARFTVEFYRGDERGWILPGKISTSQGIALAVLVATPIVYWVLKRMAEQERFVEHEGEESKVV